MGEAPSILPRGVQCPGCGYDMGGLAPGACPECGRWHPQADFTWQIENRAWVKETLRRGQLLCAVLAAVVVLGAVGLWLCGGGFAAAVGLGITAAVGGLIAVGMNGAWLIRRGDRRRHALVWVRSLWILLLPYAAPVVAGGLGAASGGLEGLASGMMAGVAIGALLAAPTLLVFLAITDLDNAKIVGAGRVEGVASFLSVACALWVGFATPMWLAIMVCGGQTG